MGARWKRKVLAIVVLSFFILYFECCVQILVPPSGLKDGSNNIRPLRNQFQMLNMTYRSWKFGVGRKGGYQVTPCFLRDLYFSQFAAAFQVNGHWSCTTMQNGELFALWHFQQQSSLHSQPSIAAGRVKNRHHIA